MLYEIIELLQQLPLDKLHLIYKILCGMLSM